MPTGYVFCGTLFSLFGNSYVKTCTAFLYSATFMELVDTYKQQLHHFMAGTTVNEFKALFSAPITSSGLANGKVSVKLKLKNFWGDKTLGA